MISRPFPFVLPLVSRGAPDRPKVPLSWAQELSLRLLPPSGENGQHMWPYAHNVRLPFWWFTVQRSHQLPMSPLLFPGYSGAFPWSVVITLEGNYRTFGIPQFAIWYWMLVYGLYACRRRVVG